MEGKNKIIVYRDWKTTFDSLSDEEAGKLIKHFFNYVNDLNPEPPDRLTALLFEPIKQTLKRDLEKYKSICLRNKENGEQGGRPKKETQDNPKNPVGYFGLKNNPEKPDSDNDSDNDNGSVNDNKELNWKNSFEIYLSDCKKAYKEFNEDIEAIKTQSRLNPGIDVKLSIEKGFINFWGTEAGWKHKKKSRSKDIDWRSTIINSIQLNKVFLPKC